MFFNYYEKSIHQQFEIYRTCIHLLSEIHPFVETIGKFQFTYGRKFNLPIHMACEEAVRCVRSWKNVRNVILLLPDIVASFALMQLDGVRKQTPLHIATVHAPSLTVQLMLEFAPDAAIIGDAELNTPLHYAPWERTRPHTFRLIFKVAPYISRCINSRKQIPLHVATRAYNLEAVETLVSIFPAGVVVEDDTHTSPLSYHPRQHYFFGWYTRVPPKDKTKMTLLRGIIKNACSTKYHDFGELLMNPTKYSHSTFHPIMLFAKEAVSGMRTLQDVSIFLQEIINNQEALLVLTNERHFRRDCIMRDFRGIVNIAAKTKPDPSMKFVLLQCYFVTTGNLDQFHSLGETTRLLSIRFGFDLSCLMLSNFIELELTSFLVNNKRKRSW